LEDSVAMIRLAADLGTTDIVASPHASPDYAYQPELTRLRIDEIRAAAGSSVRIHQGCDFHLSFANITDAIANPRKYTINGKRYLLVEFSDFGIFPNTAQIFERMMGPGMIPVITHPERNPILQERIDDLAKWVSMGCRIQVTGASLLGRFGADARSASEELLARGLVHAIASDAHDTRHRPPDMKTPREHLSKHHGAEIARLLTVDNPGAVIAGSPIPGSTPAARRRKWYRFW
jgi:protein-tyrosine phosphatase